MLYDLKMFVRYAPGLNSYLSHTLTPTECRWILTRQLETRDDSFLLIIEGGIYGAPSPGET